MMRERNTAAAVCTPMQAEPPAKRVILATILDQANDSEVKELHGAKGKYAPSLRDKCCSSGARKPAIYFAYAIA